MPLMAYSLNLLAIPMMLVGGFFGLGFVYGAGLAAPFGFSGILYCTEFKTKGEDSDRLRPACLAFLRCQAVSLRLFVWHGTSGFSENGSEKNALYWAVSFHFIAQAEPLFVYQGKILLSVPYRGSIVLY